MSQTRPPEPVAPPEGRGRRSWCALFRRDRKGAAAIEFALILPLLLVFYFMSMELSQGIEVNRKVGRIGSMVGDLVTQEERMSRTEVEAIMAIGESILQPYNRTRASIAVTAIAVSNDTSNPKASVTWSRRLDNGTFRAGEAKGTEVTIPASILIPGSFVVRVTSGLDYRPVLTWSAEKKAGLGLASAFDSIAMGETYYLVPRKGLPIACATC